MRRKGSKDNSESPHGAVRKGKEKKREGARAQGKGKDVRKESGQLSVADTLDEKEEAQRAAQEEGRRDTDGECGGAGNAEDAQEEGRRDMDGECGGAGDAEDAQAKATRAIFWV